MERGWFALVVQHGLWRELYSERVIVFKAYVCQIAKAGQFAETLHLSRGRCIPRRNPDRLTHLGSYETISHFRYRELSC